jgi:hypothetical protein
MSRKLHFVYITAAAIIISGCAHNPAVISCPVPPGEYMAPPEPLPKLEGGLARQVFEALAKDQEAYNVMAARLTGLQTWGRAQCGWQSP